MDANFIAMYVRCKNCGHKEELNKHFILKVIGGAVSGFGFWAWVAYFFAGTGFVLPIYIALVTGGVAITAFSNEIGTWLSSRYDCPHCKRRNWEVIKDV